MERFRESETRRFVELWRLAEDRTFDFRQNVTSGDSWDRVCTTRLTCPVRLRVNVAPDSNVLDLLRPESQVTMRWKHVEPALVDATHFMSLSIMIRSEDFVLGETKNRKTGDVSGRDVRVFFELEDSPSSSPPPVLRIYSDDDGTVAASNNMLKLPDLIVNETQNVRVSLLGSATTPTTTLRATVQYIDTNNCIVKKTRNISVFFRCIVCDNNFNQCGARALARI